MKILVTGGTGFIGSNFVRYVLENNPEVYIVNLDLLTYAGSLENLKNLPNQENYHFVKGDILDGDLVKKLLKEHEINGIIHFAAESHVDRSILGPSAFVQTNIMGTFSLLEAARKIWLEEMQLGEGEVRFHHISTDEVYGSLGETGFFTEDTPYDPKSPYSASKASSDHLVRAYNNTYGLPIVISNCSNNYGSHQFPEKLIPLSINNIKNNKQIPIYGKGDNIRDWLFVEDHAKAIDIIFHKGKEGDTYNIGGNNEWTNLNLIHKLCDIMDEKLGREKGSSRKLISFVKDRAGHDKRYAIDSSKLMNELGWKPSLQFEEGLEKTVDWYLNNQEWINNVISGDYAKYYEKQYGNRDK